VAERVRIASDAIAAEIDPFGAELQSLTDAQGREYLSSGDPAYWSGRAPLLFPIVGRLNGDALRIDGQSYPMRQHGFARTSHFAVLQAGPSEAAFRLSDSEATRAVYPFAFELDVHFRVAAATIFMTATVRNTGDGVLPASFGYHPAFAWPLPGDAPRGDHSIAFDHPEPAPLAALSPDGLIEGTRETPVNGALLPLGDSLFNDGALIWQTLTSRRLSYGAINGPDHGARLDIAFPDTDWLGIWTKPGAPFVCIEPWAGCADTIGFAGDFRDKPGVMAIAPGTQRRFRMDVTVRT